MSHDLDPMQNPQNPYMSCMVKASAGSGKTYQLSHRFLNLVAAGSHPAKILTITFTVKAANEMRTRILEEASRLLIDPKRQQAFDALMMTFYRSALEDQRYPQDLAPPHKAVAVGEMILAATQQLRIATIDSIFKQWVDKFPWEASHDPQGNICFKAPSQIMDTLDKPEFDDKAWNRLFSDKSNEVHQLWQSLVNREPETSLLSLKNQVIKLDSLHHFLWQLGVRQHYPLHHFEIPTLPFTQEVSSISEIIGLLQNEFFAIADVTSRADMYRDLIIKGDHEGLIQHRLLTKDLKISGSTIREKKRAALSEPIHVIEDVLTKFFDGKKLRLLNRTGQDYLAFYLHWQNLREQLKMRREVIEFNDLTKGCFRIFNQDQGMGARWLLLKSVNHLLLDEFQDTSLMQWHIFQEMSMELLSGHGSSHDQGALPSLFIVGDEKQSIYGFREADPTVMNLAGETLREFSAETLGLNHSYRTAQIILDFVNQFFCEHGIANFPLHQTATSEGQAFIPNCGRIVMRECFQNEEEESLKAIEKEAIFIAQYLAQAISGADPHPVYDKSQACLRPLTAGDCCILYRNATHVEIFEKALRAVDLPYRREERKGFFTRQEIIDTMALLNFLCHPNDLHSLAVVIQSPLSPFCDKDLINGLDQSHRDKQPWTRCDSLLRELQKTDPDYVGQVNKLQRLASELPPHQLLLAAERLLSISSRYLISFHGIEGQLAERNVKKLVQICLKLENDGYASLSSCCQRLKQMAESDAHGSAPLDQEAINLMTIHKAKGLEYPLVVITQASEPWHRNDPYWCKVLGDQEERLAYIGIKEQRPSNDPSFDSILEAQNQSLYQESLRLLYVAMTRASHYLLITGHEKSTKKPDPFFAHMKDILRNHSEFTWDEEEKLLIWDTRAQFSIEHKSVDKDNLSGLRPLVVDEPFDHPSQVKIVSPHASAESKTQSQSNIQTHPFPNFATAIGLYIHSGLECHVMQKPWNGSDHWAKLCVDVKQLSEADAKLAHVAADKELIQLLDSDVWQQLLQNSQSLEAEVDVVSFDGQQMVRGSIDLLCTNKDGSIHIIDYKTSYHVFDLDGKEASEEELLHYSRQKGYHTQLFHYREAIAKIYPHSEIKTSVLFTKIQKLVPMVSHSPF